MGVQKIDAALRKAAAKMGADAVVIVSDRTQVTRAIVTGPWYARTVQQTTGGSSSAWPSSTSPIDIQNQTITGTQP